ncbi:tri-snRNP-associated protein 2 [Seminavis robusta]|uniref:Tri-snRNP-associated protein 2 n=1 Tax=Seminavis robusta TaxID=568900 RepID=A0A9N8H5U9_9STRA|nr:tri-snRNP-associated protein 2 [Seminavis robusta]|eukprot:Sro31_g020280.1 tri-snRNP-associated protein 2 (618) ;mRNA; r:81600-83587
MSSGTTTSTTTVKEGDPAEQGTACPYLDTIQRSLLDFDFEPSCSVSLQSGPHIYGCLVCGKFFRGRGQTTPAYTHSVQDGHFVFLHLAHSKFYCLPDNYEIQDASLQDIADALHPTFSSSEIAALDSNTKLARDLFGRSYLPGFVGLNNLNKTDCINACVQALAHVPPLRDYFLRQPPLTTTTSIDATSSSSDSQIVSAARMSQHITHCFGGLVRKLWSDKRFKNHIDPHMLTQAIAAASRFQIGTQMEAGEFMAWFLHQLHRGLGGSDKKKKKKRNSTTSSDKTSIIQTIFQGSVQVTTRQLKKQTNATPEGQDDRGGSGDEAEDEEEADNTPKIETEEIVTDSNFLHLTLDISQKPLFRNEDGGLVIPQEPLVTVLKKFDGMSFSDAVSRSGVAQQRRYRIRQLPPYLILHLARFQSNRFLKEKNHTIVPFPVKNLDLGNYVFDNTDTDTTETDGNSHKKKQLPTEEEIRSMSIKELRAFLTKHGQEHLMDYSPDKKELVDHIVDFTTKSLPDLLADKYDLVANITHESPAEVGKEGQSDPLQEGSYKCHVQHRGTQQWYEIQDLHVQEVMPQLIGLSESSLLIFERKNASTLSYEPKATTTTTSSKKARRKTQK